MTEEGSMPIELTLETPACLDHRSLMMLTGLRISYSEAAVEYWPLMASYRSWHRIIHVIWCSSSICRYTSPEARVWKTTIAHVMLDRKQGSVIWVPTLCEQRAYPSLQALCLSLSSSSDIFCCPVPPSGVQSFSILAAW